MARTVTLPSGIVAELREPSPAEWALILEGDDFDAILTKIVLAATVRPRMVIDREPGPGEVHYSQLGMGDVGFLLVKVMEQALTDLRRLKLPTTGH